MPKGVANKRYTPEFKKKVIETMLQEKLSYKETARRFGTDDKRIAAWERIYLEEGAEGFALERRGRRSTGRAAPETAKSSGRGLISGGAAASGGE